MWEWEVKEGGQMSKMPTITAHVLVPVGSGLALGTTCELAFILSAGCVIQVPSSHSRGQDTEISDIVTFPRLSG